MTAESVSRFDCQTSGLAAAIAAPTALIRSA